MRFRVAPLAILLAILAGCAPLTLTRPNELYLATDYAPRPAGMTVDLAPSRVDPCKDGLGIEPTHGTYPVSNIDFRALPGMTIAVTQATGRLSGASDAPIVSRWTWRIPNTTRSKCGSRYRWTPTDVAVARSLLNGAQAKVGAAPPDGDVGNATAWAFTMRCLLERPVPAGCGNLPTVDGDPVTTRLYQPFAHGLALRLRPRMGPLTANPPSEDSLALRVSKLATRDDKDTPATDAAWDKAIGCERPDHWSTTDAKWQDCPAPFKSLVFNPRLAEVTGITGDHPVELAPILRRPLTLLAMPDPLFLAAPLPVEAMASPSYDLNGGAPGSGGRPPGSSPRSDTQAPLKGDAYQGFTAIDLLIPIRIAGEPEPLLVPVTTTVEDLHGWLGRNVLSIGRLSSWLPARLSVAEDRRCTVKTPAASDPQKPPTQNCVPIPANRGRVYFRFERGRGRGDFLLLDRKDMLLAPGDLVILG